MRGSVQARWLEARVLPGMLPEAQAAAGQVLEDILVVVIINY